MGYTNTKHHNVDLPLKELAVCCPKALELKPTSHNRMGGMCKNYAFNGLIYVIRLETDIIRKNNIITTSFCLS